MLNRFTIDDEVDVGGCRFAIFRTCSLERRNVRFASSINANRDLHMALPEASAVMGSVVLVVRRSNGVDGGIDVIDRIDGFAWCLYGILMGRMSSKKARRQSFGRFGPLARPLLQCIT